MTPLNCNKRAWFSIVCICNVYRHTSITPSLLICNRLLHLFFVCVNVNVLLVFFLHFLYFFKCASSVNKNPVHRSKAHFKLLEASLLDCVFVSS